MAYTVMEGSVCKQTRVKAVLGRAICNACWRKELYGLVPCTLCAQPKVIYQKSLGLCKQCYKNCRARQSLRDYAVNFDTPYPHNKGLFNLLITTVEWESVEEKVNRRFRAFGRFLQTYQFPQPLTWETIEEALPELGLTNRTNPKLIRFCLLELGHLLAARNKLESRETYIASRFALQPIQSTAPELQGLLHRYATWLWEHKTAPATVRDHCEDLAAFWYWSIQLGINSPEQVQPSLINDYLQTLYWQWQCSKCQGIVGFEPRHRKPPRICPNCGAVHSLSQVKRYAQNTVRHRRSKLRVFFNWAKSNRLIVINPVQRQVAKPEPTIRHYPPEVIRQLCEYVVAPDAEPVEALVLYLIIFHALSVWELQPAKIPAVIPMREDILPLGFGQAYYLIVPKREPSRGNRSPGHPSIRLDFPPTATPWLKPLLERFEHQRQQKQPHQSSTVYSIYCSHLSLLVTICQWVMTILFKSCRELP